MLQVINSCESILPVTKCCSMGRGRGKSECQGLANCTCLTYRIEDEGVTSFMTSFLGGKYEPCGSTTLLAGTGNAMETWTG